jgi:GT2 family glycosyltransferase
MSGSKKIGVVTVTYNSAKVLEPFLKSIQSQTYKNYHLYIIDNESQDKTSFILSNEKILEKTCIFNKNNVGVATGNNQGIKLAIANGCEYILLINNDTEFDETLFENLVQGINADNHEIIVPKILYFDQKNKIWSAGGYFNKLMGFRAMHIGLDETDDGRYDLAREVEYSNTCCMLLRSSVFRKIGLMDETYFVYWDDADFCLRAYRNKIKILYQPKATLYHKVSSLTGQNSQFSTTFITKNFVYFSRKNFPLFSLIWLTVYFAFLHIKLIFFLDNVSTYSIKRKAFIDGFFLSQISNS